MLRRLPGFRLTMCWVLRIETMKVDAHASRSFKFRCSIFDFIFGAMSPFGYRVPAFVQTAAWEPVPISNFDFHLPRRSLAEAGFSI